MINNRDKVIMTNPIQERQECWLAEQAFLNPNCKVESTELAFDLDYTDIVTIRYVTSIGKITLSDALDLGRS